MLGVSFKVYLRFFYAFFKTALWGLALTSVACGPLSGLTGLDTRDLQSNDDIIPIYGDVEGRASDGDVLSNGDVPVTSGVETQNDTPGDSVEIASGESQAPAEESTTAPSAPSTETPSSEPSAAPAEETIAEPTQTTDPTSDTTTKEPIVDVVAEPEPEPELVIEEPTPTNKIPVASSLTINIELDTLGRVCPNPIAAKTATLIATDDDGDTLTYRIVTDPAYGTAEITDNKITYTPGSTFTDTDEFTFAASDGKDESTSAVITVASERLSNAPQTSESFVIIDTALNMQSSTFSETYGPQAATVAYVPQTNSYEMYFEYKIKEADNTCVSGYWGIGHASSSDGKNWTQDNTPIVTPKSDTEYACGAAQPGVLYDGTKFHLAFTTSKSSSKNGLAYATSNDGITFSTPVKIMSGNKGFPSLVKVNGVLSIYYFVQNGKKYYIERLYSNDDGTTWDIANNINKNMLSTKDAWASGTLYATTDRIVTHSVFCDPTDDVAPYKMTAVGVNQSGKTTSDTSPYYVGGLLESSDGVTWTISDALPIMPNPFWHWHHETLLYGNDYLMWYKLVDGSNKAYVEMATTLDAWPIQ